MPIALVVHGGAKEIAPGEEAPNRQGCVKAAEAGWSVLRSGGSAIDAVVAAIRILEDEPIFNAGLGSELNADGEVQMDAALMEGRDRKAGAVAFLQGVWHPICVAQEVLRSGEVFVAGDGAYQFARETGCELCPNEALVTKKALQHWEEKKTGSANNTVGCVALDESGLLACGASTGGLVMSRRGRVGDSPQIGCGIYADNELGAASLTGDGEQIARLVMAKSIVDKLAEATPEWAASSDIQRLESLTGGEAGCIVLDKKGNLGWDHNSKHMAVAYMLPNMSGPHCYLSKEEERAVAA